MISISSFLDVLRRNKCIGRADDVATASIMYRSKDSLLLYFSSDTTTYSWWSIIRRTSYQHYTLVFLFTLGSKQWSEKTYFRNSRLTADYIKNLIHNGGNVYEN